MYAALHMIQGPPTHHVAYGLTVRALLQLLSYLPVFSAFLARWMMTPLTLTMHCGELTGLNCWRCMCDELTMLDTEIWGAPLHVMSTLDLTYAWTADRQVGCHRGEWNVGSCTQLWQWTCLPPCASRPEPARVLCMAISLFGKLVWWWSPAVYCLDTAETLLHVCVQCSSLQLHC